MKKFVCITILLISHLICLAQSEFGDYEDSFRERGMRDSIQRPDSASNSTVPHFRDTWKWMHNGVYTEAVPLDTLLDGIQNFNYIFKKSIANTYLGNFPSPYEANIFITRNTVQDFYPLTYIRAFLFRPEDALYFNTTTPFTRLRYFTGGGKGKAENLLDVWHVQNIRPWWSAGIRYNLISSDGRYASQKSKAYNFSLFSTYEKDRIALTLFWNQNNGHFRENGGIKERSYVTDSTGQQAENIPIWLNGNGAKNSYRNTNVNLQAHYHLGKAKAIATEKDTSYTYPAKVVLNVRGEGNEREYREESINYDYFPNTYIDSSATYDHIQNKIIDLSARFVLNEHPKYKYLPGVYAGLDFKHENYNQRIDYDTVQHLEKFGKTNYSGTYLTAGIFNVDTNTLLNYDISGKLCLAGHYAGNFKLSGYIRQALNKRKSSLLRADANIELKSVNPFLDLYVGNHNIWKNDFKPIKTIEVEGRYINTRLRTEVGIGLSNIFSYVYFDTTAMPRQTNKALTVLTAWGKENFRAGHFYFDQTVYFQKSTQEDLLSLPAISVYSHNYYINHLFKRALELQVGIDLFYNTKFYSDNYIPSIMQFYNQRKYKTGNYPKVDVFLNFHIKRAMLFVKYEHVNYHIKKYGNYFSAADYPINPGMLKFGVQWDFFD
ncbi:MAG: putative porin [Odoribacter sp.]|nr:putative porin [Odoribacter sp.]